MLIVRIISLFLIVVSLMLLGADAVSTLEKDGGSVVRSLNEILVLFGFNAQNWCEQMLSLEFGHACIAIVSSPGWAVVGIPGAVLGLLTLGGERRRPPDSQPPITR